MSFSTFAKRVVQALSISVSDLLKKVWNFYRSIARRALEKMIGCKRTTPSKTPLGGKIYQWAQDDKVKVVDCGLGATADARKWIEEAIRSKLDKVPTIKIEDL